MNDLGPLEIITMFWMIGGLLMMVFIILTEGLIKISFSNFFPGWWILILTLLMMSLIIFKLFEK